MFSSVGSVRGGGKISCAAGKLLAGGICCVAILTFASEVDRAGSTIYILSPLGRAHMTSIPTNATSAAGVFHNTSHCILPPCSHTMILPPQHDSASIFADGRLKAGIYRIQNIAGHTYLDIREKTQELCCRPGTTLEGKGFVSSHPPPPPLPPCIPVADRLQWEILPLGAGYTIRRVRYLITSRVARSELKKRDAARPGRT